MRVLVTGNTGFIGSNMEVFLLRKNVEVVGYSRRNGYNVLDIEQLRKAAKNCGLIYHFAARARPGESVLEPIGTIEENLRGCLNVLEVCREQKIPLVYPSSCEVYGDSDTPINELHEFRPTNPYAASKAAVDRICYMYSRCYQADVKIVRLFNPYGPKQQLNKVVTTFCLLARENKPLTVYGDGTDLRDYVYISDVVEGLWLARKLPPGEPVNLATGRPTSNLQLAELVIRLLDSKSSISFVDYPKAFGGIRRQVGSSEKAGCLMGWFPKVALEDGVKRTAKWLCEVVPYA